MRALIGTMVNAHKIVAIRYDGDQSTADLDKNLPSWVGSSATRRLLGGGEVTNLGEAWCAGTVHRKDQGAAWRDVHSFVIASQEDYKRLKTESLHDVKTEQLAREDADAGKSKKTARKCHYKQDAWRPDELYLLVMNSGPMRWCRLTTDGKWESIIPATEYVAKPSRSKKTSKKKTASKTEQPQQFDDDVLPDGREENDDDYESDDEALVDKMVYEPEINMDIDYEE